MAFLYGVLDAVKNENEVTTYDTDKSKDINTVIKKLEDNIGSGRTGLAASVDAVRGWLEGYEGEVREKTGNVIIELSWLQDHLSGKYFNRIHFSQKLEEQLEKWKTTLGDIEQDVTHIESIVNMLDSNLKTTLMHETKVIKKSVQVLKKSAQSESLMGQVRFVDEALVNEKTLLDRHIEDECHKVKQKLKAEFWKMSSEINNMHKNRWMHFKKINENIDIAKKFLDNDFENNYTSKILGMLHEIKMAVSNIHGNLMSDKAMLLQLVSSAQENFVEIQNGVGTSESSPGSIYEQWGQMKLKIAKLVGQIIGDGQQNNDGIPNNEGLTQIQKGIIEFANGFKEEAVQEFLAKWIAELVEDGVGYGKIYAYVTNNESKLKGVTKPEKTGNIRDAIKRSLSGFISSDIRSAAQETFRGVSVTNIGATFEKFANQVDNNLTKGVNSSIELAVKAIVVDVKSGNHHQEPDLTEVVKDILKLLVTRFKQVATELSKFVTASKMGNLRKIIAHVESVGQEFKGGNGDYAKQITSHLETLKTKIETLGNLLGKNIGGNGSLQNRINSESNGLQSVLKELETLLKDDFGVGHDVVINAKRSAAEENMKALKTALSERLDTIQQTVSQCNKELINSVKSIRDALNASHEKNKEAINALKESTGQKVQAAFTQLTNQIRAMYAEQRAVDLQAFQNSVVSQLSEMQSIIDKHKVTGVKGLLGKVNKQFVKRLDDYVPKPQSRDGWNDRKLKDIAKKLIEVNGFLFYNLEHQPDFSFYYGKVQPCYDSLINLLKHLEKSNEYDHVFTTLFERFVSALHDFAPKNFSTPCSPLLAPLKAGLAKFTEQLGHAYVNRYSGQKYTALTVTKTVKEPSKTGESGSKVTTKTVTDLTPEGRNCAKVCLTIVEILVGELEKLKEDSMLHKNKQINTYKHNVFGKWFEKRGYRVTSEEGKHHGELQDKSDMTGRKIYDDLLNTFVKSFDKQAAETWGKQMMEHKEAATGNRHPPSVLDILDYLYTCLNRYNDVCHLSTLTSTRKPCNVYEMLVWLSGLPHHPVHTAMRDVAILELIQEPDDEEKHGTEVEDGLKISLVQAADISLPAYPRIISYENIRAAVTHICSEAYDVLIGILGTGDELTIYGSDYANNSMKLHYPTSGQDCLDMFLDILRRMLPTLSFLKSQCSLTTEHRGWYDCEYGMNTAPAKWPCKDHSSDKATSQPTKQPKCQPTCDANIKVNCQPTSPLMSYLNDCLPGHLPHQLSKIGCKYECATCPSTSKKGMPCLTPLGFRGFSGSTKKGRDVCKALTKFLDNVDISCLFTLMPMPPATLPEHFGFALSVAQYINTEQPVYVKTDTFSYAFESSIGAQSVELYKDSYALTKSIVNAYGSDALKHSACESYHLQNLTINSVCNKGQNKKSCVPYVSSLCNYSYEVVAHKHASTYLSWAIYLPWTFWDLLNNLYNAFCSINCQDWGCRGCLRGDKCKKGEHGVVDTEKPNNKCQCTSIVDCKGVAPTLYQYGFVFGEASTLNDKASPKKCSDFCSQLKNVLNSQYFKKLFEECDNFLWRIREPFSYLVLSLWLLSILYLIHIMVIRLDLLHIKSHLHSPSSHRIAAQSLLAAARVNKLGRVFYLQP
ncbi:hypothetical protein, conserved [Babesia bigemina]|uniref:C3H1-type domain-containing protein n=1 Tax=Babesia bigemina TaxID=5866 RepID=A0A061BTD7_BABBI|nr:hypothetical protein, conserved [Babesia bigemina]CDR71774.1 hypothetical protein, conserved [Babesia bigemina]|eukprot:XP_012770718.1 hypothetical protein, conserved [Babesia bigemina]